MTVPLPVRAAAPFPFGPHDAYSMAHRVSGRPILPGMLMLALALRAVAGRAGSDQCRALLLDLRWPASAWVGEHAGRLVATQRPDGSLVVDAESGRGAELVFHCRVGKTDGGGVQATLPEDTARELVVGGSRKGFYEAIAGHGVEHDPLLRVVRRSLVGDGRVLFLASAEPLEREHDLPVSAALLNAAFGALLAMRPRGDEDRCVPLSIARVQVLAPMQRECVGVAKRVRSTADTFVADVEFYGRDGRLLVRLEGLMAFCVAGAEPKPASVAAWAPMLQQTAQSRAAGAQSLLLEHIAQLVHADVSSLEPTASLMGLGLTSVQLLDLARHVESTTGVALYPTFFFEYQTVSEAALYLADHWPEEAVLQPGTRPETGPTPTPRPAAEDGDAHAIAIVGMACRFADSETPAEFWRHLANGDDLVGEVPADRWDQAGWFDPDAGESGSGRSYCRWGSFIDGVDRFDAGFFGITPAEARAMDPQLRLLLEVLYHAIEDAGCGQRYRGSRTGVYVGACFREYMDEMLRQQRPVGAYDLTGGASTFLSNRASYAFDLRGPSMTIDVACSSSLVALHLACAALRAGEAEAALVAGTNLLLSPVHYLHFSALQALSPTGRCHAFDARADGYVPGEGVAAVMLKPLDRARADGDRIHAVIRGSAVNHSGRSNSPTAPSIAQEAEVLRLAWADAGIDPRTLGYLEAHGTGTRLGDPIEIEAINKALAPHVPVALDCHVGSVKANIGHTEGTAGLAGLIKVVQMLRHGQIPGMPNLAQPNPLLRLSERPLTLNRELVPWPSPELHPRRAGVSSFGIGGGYAHAVLEEAPPVTTIAPRAGAQVFPISAHSTSALLLQVQALLDWLEQHPGAVLERLACHLQHGKEALPHRMAAVAGGTEELRRLLHIWLAAGPGGPPVVAGEAAPPALRDTAELWARGRQTAWPEARHGSTLDGDDALPYRFERASYWFDTRGDGAQRALGHAALVNQARPTALRLTSSAAALAAPWSGQHRLKQRAIVPGVVQLEMFVQAATRVGDVLPLKLRDVYWLAPLEDGASCVVDLRRADEAAAWEAVMSLPAGEILASADIMHDGDARRPPPLDVPAFLAQARLAYGHEDLYAELAGLGLDLGEHFRTIESIRVFDDECLATLADAAAREGDCVLAPGVMDGINHCLRGLQTDDRRLGLAVPYHVGTVVCHASTRDARHLRGRRGTDPGTYDVDVLDGAGKVLVELRGFLPRDFNHGTPSTPRAIASGLSAASRDGAGAAHVPVQEQLEALMAEATGLSPAQIHSGKDLATMGVDSVAVAQFTRKVNRHFGTRLTPAHFFDHKDLNSYAAFLLREMKVDPGEGMQAPEPHAPLAATSDAIAIVGASGRFPGCADLDTLWQRLIEAEDLVGEVPADRFDWRQVSRDSATSVRHGAFLDDIDLFAASTFGISRREAELMDPQQRLMLEAVHDLFLDAGYARADVRGGDTGVFIGVVNNEYYELLNEHGIDIEAHTSTGMARCLLANRVSHHFDLGGPSEVIDTACSSSLVAVHRAIQAILAGECTMAVAGGINLLLTPKLFISFSKAGMLSPDGRCRAFGAGANGYVRGEGCGAVLLKRLDQALRDGDAVHAVIRGSGVGHGGRAPSLTAPNPQAQAALVQQVLRKADVPAAAVGYVEAHGTGTPLGDPIEINGLKRVFAETADGARCGVGSIKSNMGHLEGAAGIAGLLKVMLAIQHRTLPASLHAREINPQIDLQHSPLYVVGRTQAWRQRRADCIAGVSSFGFGGVNAHVLLGGSDVEPPDASEAALAGGFPVLLSAASEAALKCYAGQLDLRLSDPRSRLGAQAVDRDESRLLADVACTLATGREPLAWRAGFVAGSRAELSQRLQALARGELAFVDTAALPARAAAAGTLCDLVRARDSDGVVALWRSGAVLPWAAVRDAGLQPFGAARRLPLPTPPLPRESYWLPGRHHGAAPMMPAAASPARRPSLSDHPFLRTT